MSSPQALKILLWAKRRRVEQAEAEVVQQQAVLADCRARQAQAEQHEQACRDEQQACFDKMQALSMRSEGFDAADIVTFQHVLDTLKTRHQQAAQAVQQAEHQCAEAELLLLSKRQAVKRAQQQVEHIEARRKALLQAQELAQEDSQDEESEEAAVARILAARAREQAALAEGA